MGRLLAVDPGTVRVGLAVSDPLGITAQPLEVVAAGSAVARISEVCSELGVEQVLVGLPTTERGEEGASARMARELATAIEEETGLPVITVDERYTSRMAESVMVDAGAKRRRRRAEKDKVAAAMLLRGYLDGLAGDDG